MPVSQTITVNIDANQIYQGSNVVSNGRLTLTIPFTFTNMSINSTIPSLVPELIWALDANGNSLEGMTALGSTTPTRPHSNPPTISVPMQLGTLPSGTAAVVINVTVPVSMSVQTGQNSGTFNPTCSIVQNNPTSLDVGFDVDGTNSVTATSSSLVSQTNFPSSFNVTPVVQQPSRDPVNPVEKSTSRCRCPSRSRTPRTIPKRSFRRPSPSL